MQAMRKAECPVTFTTKNGCVFLISIRLCFFPVIGGLGKQAFGQIRRGEMLSDEHINAAHCLIGEEYKDINGLAPPLTVTRGAHGYVMNYAPYCSPRDYVQIINTGKLHWVTLVIKDGKFMCTVPALSMKVSTEVTVSKHSTYIISQ